MARLLNVTEMSDLYCNYLHTYLFTDSTVTPLGPPEDNTHGQIIESDSLSDFYLNEAKQQRHPKHHRKKKSYHSDHTADEGIDFRMIYWTMKGSTVDTQHRIQFLTM